MEIQFPSLLLFTFLLSLFLLAKIVIQVSNGKKSYRKLPPGPWRLPLIGNLHQLFGSLPHRALRDLAEKHGPLMRLQLGEVSTIVVSSPELAKQVMKTHDTIFARRPFLFYLKYITYDYTDTVYSPYGNYWRQLRKICTTELLNTKQVRSFQSIREDEVLNLIKAIHSNQESVINLSDKLFAMTFGITGRAAFGKKCRDQDAFISLLVELIKIVSGFSLPDLHPSVKLLQNVSGMMRTAAKLHEKSDRILGEILNEHREKKLTTENGQAEAEDLVDIFLKLQQDGDLEFPITDNTIKAVILDIFAAGGETSSTTLEWAIAELLKNPRVMKEAQAEVRRVFDRKGNVEENGIQELKFLKAVVKETLRLHTPAPLLLPRENTESCEINGYEIPEKTRVLVNAWAIGRDPRHWNEAETFYPERFLDSSLDYRGTDFEYITFGAGRRICPGIAFAVPNVELPLAQLLYHFDWMLPNGINQEDFDMAESFGITARRMKHLLLIPIAHPSSFLQS
ncbi:Cytochrome P450 [Melia azedarach]|uniref:Cytochrome P450 n=1 Tax=Melia azedarach TaxID=155640 RepID=A0ACC1WSB3_MELAZ|nr:Cytochrome P450 [Melia azedarach]